MAGGTVQVPGSGTETMHHVHADDVAQAFELAVANRDAAAGEDFNVVAPSARPCAVTSPSPRVVRAGGERRGVTWERFRELAAGPRRDELGAPPPQPRADDREGADAARLRTRYEPDQAVLESIEWLIDHDQLDVARPLVV